MSISLHSAWHQSQHSVVFDIINNTSITNISVGESESESLSFCLVSMIFVSCLNSPSASHSCGYPPNTIFYPTAPHLLFCILTSHFLSTSSQLCTCHSNLLSSYLLFNLNSETLFLPYLADSLLWFFQKKRGIHEWNSFMLHLLTHKIVCKPIILFFSPISELSKGNHCISSQIFFKGGLELLSTTLLLTSHFNTSYHHTLFHGNYISLFLYHM